MRNIQVMSCNECVRYCHKKHDTPTIIISIRNPYLDEFTKYPFVSKDNNVKAILPMYFADVTDGEDAMNKDMGEAIVNFVTRHPNEDIIVHCEMGVSRSAGVAAALMKYFNGDDMPIFRSYKYRPNMTCYRMVINAFYDVC